jgi:hypothetical protein
LKPVGRKIAALLAFLAARVPHSRRPPNQAEQPHQAQQPPSLPPFFKESTGLSLFFTKERAN